MRRTRSANERGKTDRSILCLILTVLAAIASLVWFLFQPIPSIAYSDFEPRFSAAMQNDDFRFIEERSCSGEDVPLPWYLWRFPQNSSDKIHLSVGLTDSAFRFKLTLGGSRPFEYYVRYIAGRAVFVDIRAHMSEAEAAGLLRSRLAQEFPGLAVKVSMSP